MTTQKKGRKDWVLLIFIIPIGVLLLLFVGQWAIRLLPFWSVNAGMNSNLEPNTGAAHPFALLEPLLPQILIPLPWAETYLLPGDGEISFPPFLTFEPTASPPPTAVAATEDTPTPTATPTETPVPTSSSVAGTAPTNAGGGEEETPTETATSPSPSPSSSPSPSPSPSSSPSPSPSPTTPPTPVCPGANNPGGPLPCDYGTVSTPPPSVILDSSPDTNIEVGGLPNNTDPSNDSNIGTIADGTYIVLSLNIVVEPTPDNFYDLVFYEWNNGGSVYMDLVIIGITNDDTGNTYYEVFNWGNGTPDMNSNVGDMVVTVGGETGDQQIQISDNNEVPVTAPENVLHDPDYDPGNPPGIPETNGPLPQTGILIDVDTATSNPPPGTYNYVIIISPPTTNLPIGDGGDAQVDAIQAVEVPIPTP